MKQPTFNGRVLLPMSVIEAARTGDPQWNVSCGIMTAISTNFVPGRSMRRTVCLICAWMNT